MQLPTSINQEPETHQANITAGETLFGSCTDGKKSLSKQEIIEWCNLREEVQPAYDENDPNCLKRLKGLWFIFTGFDLPDNQIVQAQWMSFGFQAANPITDFRAGGVQSLDDIAYFAQNNKELVQAMCDPANDYYFAASSINVTFFMKKYFHLLDHYAKGQKDEYCSRLALKNFCHFLVQEDNLWSQLHSLLLTDLFKNCWMGLRAEKPNITIMDFGLAIKRLHRKCKQAFNHRKYLNFAQLKNQFGK